MIFCWSIIDFHFWVWQCDHWGLQMAATHFHQHRFLPPSRPTQATMRGRTPTLLHRRMQGSGSSRPFMGVTLPHMGPQLQCLTQEQSFRAGSSRSLEHPHLHTLIGILDAHCLMTICSSLVSLQFESLSGFVLWRSVRALALDKYTA